MAIKFYAVERSDGDYALIRFNDITGSVFAIDDEGGISIKGNGRTLDHLRSIANREGVEGFSSADSAAGWADGKCQIVRAA